jgi:hypothetical protein
MSSNHGLENIGAGRTAACLWKRRVLELDMTLEVVITRVDLAAYVARQGDWWYMRLLVAHQVVFARECLGARSELLALFGFVTHTLERTRESGNTGRDGN